MNWSLQIAISLNSIDVRARRRRACSTANKLGCTVKNPLVKEVFDVSNFHKNHTFVLVVCFENCDDYKFGNEFASLFKRATSIVPRAELLFAHLGFENMDGDKSENQVSSQIFCT